MLSHMPAPMAQPGTCLSGVVAPGRTEDGHHTVLGPGANATVEGTDATEGDLTEAALNEEARFTVEHDVVVNTRIGLDAVFEDEDNRQAIAEVFSTLDAPAGA